MRLDHIEDLCNSEANKPGIITRIAVIDACGVTAIPDADAYDPDEDPITMDPHTITGNLTLKSGYQFYKWDFRGKSGLTYECVPTGDEDAEQFNVSVKGYIPKMTPIKNFILSRPNARYIVLVWDRNNADPRLIGEIGNGAMIKVTENSSPKNGYNLDIQGLNLDIHPYYYGGTISYAS